MENYIKRINTDDGPKQIDYTALANLPFSNAEDITVTAKEDIKAGSIIYIAGDFAYPSTTSTIVNKQWCSIGICSQNIPADSSGVVKQVLPAYRSATTLNVTLLSDNWVDREQTVDINVDLFDNNIIFVSSDLECVDKYTECGIYCSKQETNKLTFKCSLIPVDDMFVNIAIL